MSKNVSLQKVIVALDVGTLKEAHRFVKLLKKDISLYKVGSLLFTAAGPDVIGMIHNEGGRVFLDLKYHDIPHTVAKACEAAAKLGVFMVDVHTSGGVEMMRDSSRVVKSFGEKRPHLIGVTVLTSDQNNASVKKEVLKRTQLALESGLDGVVCSAWETAYLRKQIKRDFIIINPGIRFRERKLRDDDQIRIVTPETAFTAGASFIVIGRPILEVKNPLQAVQNLLL